MGLTEWIRCELGEALTLQRGFDLPHRLRRAGDVPIVSSSGISGMHDRAQVCGPGIVTGRYGHSIGEVFYIRESFWPLNTTLYVREFRGNEPLYLSYLLRTVDFASHSGKSGVPGVNRNDIHKLHIVLPPPPEQRAIAQALSDVDGLLAALEKLIHKKRGIKQAVMQQLLTGNTRLPGFSGAWETKRLGEIGPFSKGRGIKREDVSLEGLPCVRYGELYTRYHNYILRVASRIPPSVALTALPIRTGALLFAGSGETAEEIGSCAAYLGKEQAYAGGDIVVLTPLEQNSIYLGHLMNHPTVVVQKARMAQGNAVVHISASNLAQVEIELPCPAEQTAIVAVLSDMDSEIGQLEQRRDKTRSIKQGMMQALLTGRVRLVKPEPASAEHSESVAPDRERVEA